MTEDTDRVWHESPEYRQEQLSAALDGMLTPEEQAALDAHLAGCTACKQELEELRQTRALLRALPQPALPRSFLLPIESEPAIPHAPAGAIERQPAAANVTALRPRDQRERARSRATRTLQATRWLGAIAAVLGLALFLGTLLPMAVHQNSTASTNAPMHSPSGSAGAGQAASGATNTTPTPIVPSSKTADEAATATASTAFAGHGSTTPAVEQTHSGPTGPSPGDILRIVALVVFFAGALLAIVSVVVARRI